MAQGTLFVGWGPIIPGREKIASQVLGEAMGYLRELRSEGTIDSMDVARLLRRGNAIAPASMG